MNERLMEAAKAKVLGRHEQDVEAEYIQALEAEVLTTADHNEIARQLVELAPAKKIQCIKLFRLITKVGLKEAKDAIDDVPTWRDTTGRVGYGPEPTGTERF